MKVCVCAKPVPREASGLRLDPASRRLDRSGPAELNPWDAHAIEAALVLREAHGGEVVLVAMGPADTAEALRPGLAMGADRAVLVADPRLAGSDLLATSRVLAAALAAEGPDITLFGSQTADGGGAMLWSAVAHRLDRPVLSGVRDVVVDGPGTLRATRAGLGGERVLMASLPCIAALSGAVNEPRYPSFRDVVAAKRKPIELRTIDDLGLDPATVGEPGAATRVLEMQAAVGRRASGVVRPDDGSGAAWLVAQLVERGVA